MVRRRPILWKSALVGLLLVGVGVGLAVARDHWLEKRVQVIHPGRLVRGAWQRPTPLKRLVDREKIRTIVTLTAINSTDHKFVSQSQVVRERGLDWVIIPMRGSRATVEQMAIAADLLADPRRQPVFFHCVAGHHRTSLAHAAYLIRHEGYTAEQAWETVSSYSWARPDAPVDRNDQFLIEEFARVQATLAPDPGRGYWEVDGGEHAQTDLQADSRDGRRPAAAALPVDRLEPGPRQLRGGSAESRLPVGPDVGEPSEEDPS